MPPKRKFRNVRRKKRKFTGNKYTREANLKDNPIENEQESMEQSEESDNGDVTRVKETKRQSSDRAEVRSLPASIRKLDEDSGDSQESSNEWEPEEPEGFRFIDIAVLAEFFRSLWCPLCRYGRIVFEEGQNSKKGFATLLLLKCASSKCKYSSSFYSSSKVDGGQAFEVNRRVVLASRNIGVGHQGLAKFAGVMNMLPPMNENSYRDHFSAVCNAAQTVAMKSMTDAAEEAKQFHEPETDGLFDIGVSGDGTWRRRGYSSAYGVVAALSTVTGKALDVEVMSKECRECMGWRAKEGTVEFREWWEGHQHRCQANHYGSSGSMDATGMLSIFQRSVENYSVRYTEFLGDGDSKAHKLIVEQAVYGNVEVKKLECVGHVQKRLGSRLRSLKK